MGTATVHLAARSSVAARPRPAPVVDETTMIAMVGHELRAPLATLTAAAEMLEGIGSPECVAMVAAINRQVRRLVWLFDAALRATDILAGGRADRDATASPRSVIAQVVEALEEHDPRIRLSADCGAVPNVRIEPEALAVVLNNLVCNAMKHSRGSLIQITARAQGASVRVSVEDDGEGVPEHLRSKIFDMGARRAPRSGSGLGLYVSRSLLHQFDGSLRLTESAAGGASFIIDLPAAEGSCA